jgi:hypothetical protein
MGMFLFSPPAGFSGFAGNLGTLFRRHLSRSRRASLQAAFAAKGDGGLVFVRIFGTWRGAVFDLAGQNIADQLA